MRLRLAAMAVPLDRLVAQFEDGSVIRIPGRTQVFLTKTAQDLPPILCEYVAKNGALAENVVIVTFLRSARVRCCTAPAT